MQIDFLKTIIWMENSFLKTIFKMIIPMQRTPFSTEERIEWTKIETDPPFRSAVAMSARRKRKKVDKKGWNDLLRTAVS